MSYYNWCPYRKLMPRKKSKNLLLMSFSKNPSGPYKYFDDFEPKSKLKITMNFFEIFINLALYY